MDFEMKTAGSFIVSFDFSRGNDVGLMIVGKKMPNNSIEIVNVFKDEEAMELYEKLKGDGKWSASDKK